MFGGFKTITYLCIVMKKIIFISALLTLVSCTNNSMISQSEDEIKKELLDPKTYERINVNVDTLYESQSITFDFEADSSRASFYSEMYQQELRYFDAYKSLGLSSSTSYSYYTKNLSYYKKNMDSLTSQYKNKLNYKKQILGTTKDTIVRFNVHIRHYAVNRLGIKGIYDNTVTFYPNGKIKK